MATLANGTTVPLKIPAPGPTPSPATGPAPGPMTGPATGEQTEEPANEPQGCLFALSQPPLMLFLLVIGGLLGLGASYDLLFL